MENIDALLTKRNGSGEQCPLENKFGNRLSNTPGWYHVCVYLRIT